MVKELQIPEGYHYTEVGVIPNEWVVFTIEELTPKNKKYCIVDGPFGSNLKTIHYRKSGVPIITSGYVTDGKFKASNYLYVDIEKFKQEKRSTVRGGDIVMAKIGENCGASTILPIEHSDGILSGNTLKITIDENRFSTILISQIFWRYYSIGKFEELKTIGAQPAISMAILKKFKLPLPSSKPEQIAIATALSTSDELIENLEKIIIKKRNIKQGAMQELLKPKNDWLDTTLEEISDKKMQWSITGGPFGSNLKASDYTSEGIRIIQLQNIGDGKFLNDNAVYTSIDKADELLSCNIFPNEIILSKMGDPVGRACIVPNFHSRYLMCSDGIRLVVDRKKYDFNFIYLSINSPKFRKQAENSSTGTTRKRIGLKELKSLKISCPTKEVQTRIAKIFIDMEAEIEALEQKLHKYKILKQGMMQALLTGKIRLKN